MLVITEIKVVEVPGGRDTLAIAHTDLRPMIFPPSASEPIETEILTEHVKGQCFICNGEEYVFGWSKQVQEALRIPMSSFNSMNNIIDERDGTIRGLKSRLLNQESLVVYYQNIPWYTRLWNVFIGN